MELSLFSIDDEKELSTGHVRILLEKNERKWLFVNGKEMYLSNFVFLYNLILTNLKV